MVSKILTSLRDTCHVPDDVEVTLEGNPTSIETSRLRAFRAAGINRLSLGIQALNDTDLRFFGRDHTTANARRAIQVALDVFDRRVSLDMIWGRPNQTVTAWEQELRDIASYGASHLSLYQLTVERGTPLFRAVGDGHVRVPMDDAAAEMYEATVETAARVGYDQYEVSSFAKDGERRNRSRHNQSYWKGVDYIGIGPGAHGRLYDSGGTRLRTFRVCVLFASDIRRKNLADST
ncbi:hypothetical protein HKX48_007361 [Thoreauomyces humboldtii]|nr:hypothetical protein HKX48_007361 [Thoreauomyces humboldtii]